MLGYIAGFLGITFGFFIHFLILANRSSFGIPFFTPYIPFYNLNNNEGIWVEPIWKREKRNSYLNTQKPNIQDKISMNWRQNDK